MKSKSISRTISRKSKKNSKNSSNNNNTKEKNTKSRKTNRLLKTHNVKRLQNGGSGGISNIPTLRELPQLVINSDSKGKNDVNSQYKLYKYYISVWNKNKLPLAYDNALVYLSLVAKNEKIHEIGNPDKLPDNFYSAGEHILNFKHNEVEAKKWFEKADEWGHPDSKKELRKLKHREQLRHLSFNEPNNTTVYTKSLT